MPFDNDFTIGIEEEFQIIDPNSRELRSRVDEILEEGRMLLGEQVKPEMHQSMIEVGTGICRNIKEARQDVVKLRRGIGELAQRKGLAIAAASTHPISHWADQQITEHERYHKLIEEMQQTARALLIFGMHVHIGIADREAAIA
ncbi:MAG: carboxylate-amine ligase, partial [Acidobacteria bacterium]|nr:carboxylate-amine ligase [Acidobacteriota bacterium]